MAEVIEQGPSAGRPQSQPIGPNHVPLDLPSRGFFYPSGLDDVRIRGFTLLDLNAIHASAKLNSLRSHAESLGRTINVPVTMLTPGDFDMVRYWQRINSYPMRPYTLPWTCENEDHKRLATLSEEELRNESGMLDENGNLKVETTFYKNFDNKAQLTNENISVKYLDRREELAELMQKVYADFGIWLHPETMGDLIEQSELLEAKLRNEKARLKNARPDEVDELIEKLLDSQEDEFISEIAACINPVQGEYQLPKLRDRIAFLCAKTEEEPHKFGAAFMDAVYQFRELSDHGVNEAITDKCRRCGHQVRLIVELDVAHFFP